MKSWFMVLVVLLTAASGFAGTYLMDTIEYSAGDGAKSATIVIDFNADSYFVFEYKWDDLSVVGDENATGWDALDALDELSDLIVHSDSYVMPVDGVPTEMYYVIDFDFPNDHQFAYFDDGSLGWAYYGSVDNDVWAANAPVSSRSLTDGCWDAWVWTNHDMDNYWAPIRQPGQAPVPEPATMGLLALGGLLLRKTK